MSSLLVNRSEFYKINKRGAVLVFSLPFMAFDCPSGRFLDPLTHLRATSRPRRRRICSRYSSSSDCLD